MAEQLLNRGDRDVRGEQIIGKAMPQPMGAQGNTRSLAVAH
jgi:hypothetical protein